MAESFISKIEAEDITKAVVWDEEFDDPMADVILISKRGIHFRVSSHHARKKRCAPFRQHGTALCTDFPTACSLLVFSTYLPK
jgi:hypothetical protein